MSNIPTAPKAATPGTRRRLSKEERLAQLLDVSWRMIGDEGSDALTLGRLAEAAGITKPTVYEHFGTRRGLLAALYRDFDARQNKIIDAAIAASGPSLQDKARTIASSYINCVLAEGREIPGVLSALNGSPELAMMKRQCQLSFLEKCRHALTPFTGLRGLSVANLWAMLGAADSLSSTAVADEITRDQACDELYEIIISMVQRSN